MPEKTGQGVSGVFRYPQQIPVALLDLRQRCPGRSQNRLLLAGEQENNA